MSVMSRSKRPLHAADGHGLLARCVRRLIRRALRRRFAAVWSNEPPVVPVGQPVVVCANHSNWWDGFLAAATTDMLSGRRFWLLQQEEHLRRYDWFRRCGVIGIDLRGGTGALPGLRRALGVLQEDPHAFLWIFPQGRLTHPAEPIEVKPGARFLAKHSGALMLPVIIRYDWQGGARPSIWLRWGQPLPSAASAEELQLAMQGLATELDCALRVGHWPDSTPWWPPRRSINQSWDRWAGCWRGLGRGRRKDPPSRPSPAAPVPGDKKA